MKKCKISKGDQVKMNDKYYVSDANKQKVFTVLSEPWNLCGTTCVMLDGIRGGYATDGLEKVV